LFFFGIAMSTAALLFWRWAYDHFKVRGRKPGDVRLAFQFRDVITLIASMSDSKFMRSLGSLSETDVVQLRSTLSSLVAVFLQKQPGEGLLYQRLMPGIEYKVWVPGETTLEVYRDVKNGTAVRNMQANIQGRSLLACLAERHDQGNSFGSNSSRAQALASRLRKRRRRASAFARSIFADDRGALSAEEFRDRLRGQVGFEDAEIDQLLTYFGSEVLSHDTFTTLVENAIPQVGDPTRNQIVEGARVTVADQRQTNVHRVFDDDDAVARASSTGEFAGPLENMLDRQDDSESEEPDTPVVSSQSSATGSV